MTMITAKISRWVKVEGTKVYWGNIVGHLQGQTGVFEFETEQGAKLFAEWASKEGAPSLKNEDLIRNDVPTPIQRQST